MLKYNRIIINISYRNIKNYLEKGYDAKLHVDLEVNICDLPNVSHQKVIAICQLCGVENEIQYHKYLINRNRHGYYGCKGCSRVKQNLTLNKLNKIPKIYEFKDIPLVDNLSLSKDQVLKKKNVKLRSWVEKDIEFLINNYSKLSSSQIAKSLNKSIRSIRGKAYKLGLSKCNWNDDEVKLLKLIYTNNSNREIAKILNRSYSAISGKAKKLKLRIKFRRIGVPIRDSSSRRILKVCDLSRVEAK